MIYKYKVKLPMAAIRVHPEDGKVNTILAVGLTLELISTPEDESMIRVHFLADGIHYMAAPQVWADCVEPYVESKVEAPVESAEESEFFDSLRGSLEEAVVVKEQIYNKHDVKPAANQDKFDTFEENLKFSVVDAVARVSQINDRYSRDFHLRMFSDGSMQLCEHKEIVLDFTDEQGFVAGDLHGNIQKWVNMIMDVGFIDYIMNHKTSFAARYNLR